jgi:hypothetical protein
MQREMSGSYEPEKKNSGIRTDLADYVPQVSEISLK